MQLAKRFAVTVVGVALLIAGGALMVLPGPGVLLIVAGLAVLATEYVWARRLLVRAKREAEKVSEATVANPLRTAGTVLFGLAMLAVGTAMIVARSVDLPMWSPVTGAVIILTALILLTTTAVTYRSAKGAPSPYTPSVGSRPGQGSVQLDASGS